ncbi:hypothetical protein ABZ904_28810 [Streptomyces sp. NPDC046900]|uniref:hypothetical protein n=1 Tax=Streptomyces sp. NPDC046900 TaxID=3155473 RepID=UPI003402BD13
MVEKACAVPGRDQMPSQHSMRLVLVLVEGEVDVKVQLFQIGFRRSLLDEGSEGLGQVVRSSASTTSAFPAA